MIKLAIAAWGNRKRAKLKVLEQKEIVKETSLEISRIRSGFSSPSLNNLKRVEYFFERINLKERVSLDLVFFDRLVDPDRYDGPGIRTLEFNPGPLPEGLAASIARGASTQGVAELNALIDQVKEVQSKIGGLGLVQLNDALNEARLEAERVEIGKAMPLKVTSKSAARRL